MYLSTFCFTLLFSSSVFIRYAILAGMHECCSARDGLPLLLCFLEIKITKQNKARITCKVQNEVKENETRQEFFSVFSKEMTSETAGVVGTV